MNGLTNEVQKGMLMRFLSMRQTVQTFRSYMIEHGLNTVNEKAMRDLYQTEVHINNTIDFLTGVKREKFKVNYQNGFINGVMGSVLDE